jgi:integrase
MPAGRNAGPLFAKVDCAGRTTKKEESMKPPMSDPHQIKVYVVDIGRKYFALRWKDPETGEVHQESSRRTKHREALAKALDREKELNSGHYSDNGTIPWADFREQVTTAILSGVAVRTKEKIDGVLNVMEEFRTPRVLADVTGRYLSEYVAWLRQNGRAESTIRSHLRHIKATLRWAVDTKYIRSVPAIPPTPRASKRKLMKGRPLTEAEFARFLAAIPGKVNAGHEANWEHMARGLWLTGLRLEESMRLSWDTSHPFHVIVDSAGRAQLRIPDWAEKGHEDRLFPLTPDAVEFLLSTPESERSGWVFNPTFTGHRNGRHERYKSSREAGRVFSAVGESARIIVHTAKGGQQKHASAHDLRRSFGDRWSRIVRPITLMELMRHASLETTMAYYVEDNVKSTQDEIYRAWERRNAERSGDTSGDTGEGDGKKTPKK